MTGHIEDGGRESEDPRVLFVERDIWPVVRSNIVLTAFRKVDRRAFVPSGFEPLAYENKIIPLGEGASMSQPSLVAEMIDHLDLTGRERVLEVGAGSGFGAAVLSRCASEVHTVEYKKELTLEAQQKLRTLGYDNVTVYARDGVLGLPEQAPFDAIIITAGAKYIPRALVDQLVEGGRIVIPTGRDPDNLALVVGLKKPEGLLTKVVGRVYFHPLMSEEPGGWTEEALELVSALKRAFVQKLAEREGVSEQEALVMIAEVSGIPPQNRDEVTILKNLCLPDKVFEMAEQLGLDMVRKLM